MTSLIIPVHSFIDLITNSSSETYISASSSTVTAFKEIIDGILKGSGSEKTCDDLFNLTLDDSRVIVTPKDNSADLDTAANNLTNITDFFDISSEYNG